MAHFKSQLIFMMPLVLALIVRPAPAGDPPNHPSLPQDHAYQSVLRNFLAGLTRADLQVRDEPEEDYRIVLEGEEIVVTDARGRLPAMQPDPEWFANPDNRYRLYALTGRGPRQIPGGRELLTGKPGYFLLENIESPDGIRMWTGDPLWNAALWVRYPNPGNPHYNNRASQKRIAVAAAIDLIMAHHELDTQGGLIARHDFLGGVLLPPAAAFYAAREALPPDVRSAFKTGFLELFNHLEKRGPQGVHANMDMFALMSTGYLRLAIDAPDAQARITAHVRRLLDIHFHPAGYIDHGHGYDPSYMGRSIDHLVYTALAFDYDFMPEIIDTIFRLRTHLSFPEPYGDGTRFRDGPTHFATTMSTSAPHEQSGDGPRNLGGAWFSDHAVNLLFKTEYGRGVPWIPESITDADLERMITAINQAVFENAEDAAPPVWSRSHYRTPGSKTAFYLPDGLYERLLEFKALGDRNQFTLPVYRRNENFIRRFPADPESRPEHRRDSFLIARFDGYAAAIHTGRLSNWGDLSGFGGGALSVFWTPAAGPAIMGRNNNRPHQRETQDSWQNWRMWMTHAISGANAGGAFSSARERFPEKQYVFLDNTGQSIETPESAAAARVTVSGRIGAAYDGGRTTENGHITGEVRYARTFLLEPSGLTVESSLTSDGHDPATDLFETIPVFNSPGYAYRQIEEPILRRIEFRRKNAWIPATTAGQTGVDHIRIQRFDGWIEIVFVIPQTVMLAPETSRYGQVILVDLLGDSKLMPELTGVSYTIRPAKRDN